MSPKFFLLCCGFLVMGTLSFSQKIMMKIPGVTAPEGEEVVALEFKAEAIVSIGGGGITSGAAVPSSLVIKKKVGKSTNELINKMVKSQFLNEVIFEYFDKADVNYYTISLGSTSNNTLQGVFVTQLQWLTPECPTCLALEHQIGFDFKAITIDDKINKLKSTWNVASRTIN